MNGTQLEHVGRVLLALDYLEKKALSPVILEDVAKQAGYSLYHFFPVFKNIVGLSPKEYLRRRRMTWAANELLGSKTSIQTLAFQLDYDNPKPFSRAFKKQYGVNPTEYRQKDKHLWIYDQPQVLENLLKHVHSGGFQLLQQEVHFPSNWINGFGSFRHYNDNYHPTDFIQWSNANSSLSKAPLRACWGGAELALECKNYSGYFSESTHRNLNAQHSWDLSSTEFAVFYHRGGDSEYLLSIEQLWRRALVGMGIESDAKIPVILKSLEGASIENPLQEVEIWVPILK